MQYFLSYLKLFVFYTFFLHQQMADTTTTNIPDPQTKSRVLEQRRCLLLATVGATAEDSSNNSTLKSILNAGFLVHVKSWLDDILAGTIGTSFGFSSAQSLYLTL
jgi:hypothetical protein